MRTSEKDWTPHNVSLTNIAPTCPYTEHGGVGDPNLRTLNQILSARAMLMSINKLRGFMYDPDGFSRSLSLSS